jgi:hypothetical protein
MKSETGTYKPGTWIVLGTVLGAFVGLLFGKFALGLIFGFFVGIGVDARKRKAETGTAESRKSSHEEGQP